MSLRRGFWLVAGLLLFLAVLYAQRPFRTYVPLEGAASDAELPPDYKQNADFILGRLMYPSFGRGFGGNWLHGGTNWTIDYPKGDRFFARALRRLTLVDVRSVEQPVNPDDDDDIFNWPYLHVAMPSTWNLTEPQARKIRDYLQRGGFMVCDSFFGDAEWDGFERGLQRIFPDRMVEELPDDDPIFQTVYDLKQRYQVGNYRSMMGRGVPYRGNGAIPHWRTIRDDKGRAMFAINFNNDLGDSWQLADVPSYPAKDSDLGIRLGVNYVTYALTH
jgi:hypothetical protein